MPVRRPVPGATLVRGMEEWHRKRWAGFEPPMLSVPNLRKLEGAAKDLREIRYIQRAESDSWVIAFSAVIEPIVAVCYRMERCIRTSIALTCAAEFVDRKVEQSQPAAI